MIPAVILAGGLGTRIRAVAGNLPKPMIEVGGRPFIEYVLDTLVDAHVPSIHLAVSYRSDFIQSHLGHVYRGTCLSYSVEPQPLGTGGAILKCLREHNLPRALVLNGDTLFRIDLGTMLAAHVDADSQITLALCHVPDASRYGTVVCDSHNHVVTFDEKDAQQKGGLINGGVYIVERSALESVVLPDCFSFERDFLQLNVDMLHPLGVVSDGYFIDIGIPEDLERARRGLTTEMPRPTCVSQ